MKSNNLVMDVILEQAGERVSVKLALSPGSLKREPASMKCNNLVTYIMYVILEQAGEGGQKSTWRK